MAGTLTVGGMSAGLGVGEKIIGPITSTGTVAIGAISDLALSSGDNSVAVPTGAVAALIVFPAGISATVKVRTSVDSGTGVQLGNLSNAPWTVIPLPTSATSVIINSSGSVTGFTEVSFI